MISKTNYSLFHYQNRFVRSRNMQTSNLTDRGPGSLKTILNLNTNNKLQVVFSLTGVANFCISRILHDAVKEEGVDLAKLNYRYQGVKKASVPKLKKPALDIQPS